MSESVENKLYKYFKQRRFSELSFLYDEAFKSKDPLHLGLLRQSQLLIKFSNCKGGLPN